MPIQERKIINYMVVCVSEFAEKFNLKQNDAFRYLRDYKAIEFLKEHYEIEHTLSLDAAIEDMTTICVRNGGYLQ